MFLCIWRLINALHYTLGLHPGGAYNSVPREQWHGNVRTLLGKQLRLSICYSAVNKFTWFDSHFIEQL